MDLYEAIETMEKAIGFYEKYADSPYQMPSLESEEIEAMKICLEAARDKAGV